ncbi:DoxX family protein [Hyalangium sp.]|uniref:DoxX family protein n=1 Tax=Hyalangium sp. TaxID=2028555 RepID=UPI002D5ED3E1|nr:DoxX family protein [Hyalangium sp.]HYH96971.1 DoxX family protein [Hyalangium sp.]
MPPLDSPQFPLWMLQVLPVAYLAITFLQSGLDKVIDWKGNLGYVTSVFSKVPVLREQPKLMLLSLTLMELASGALSAGGIAMLVATGSPRLACAGGMVSGVTFLSLLFGQRVAKDYAGAAGLAPYFLVSLAAVYFNRG